MLKHLISNLQIVGPKEYLYEPDLSRNKMGRVVLTYIDANFELWQANKCLPQVPYWNLGELAMQLAAWLKSGLAGDFQFDCTDSEHHDLFTLQHFGSAFQFISRWNDFGEAQAVERSELVAFIEEFTAELVEESKLSLALMPTFI